MDKGKKSKTNRSGFLAVKLTNEALNYQLENYNKFTGLSSMRGKAGLALIILFVISWVTFGWQVATPLVGYISLVMVIIMAVIIYKWAKVGVTIAFVIYLLNTFFILISEPTKILGALIALYIFAYFLYPAYQVEKNRKQEMP